MSKNSKCTTKEAPKLETKSLTMDETSKSSPMIAAPKNPPLLPPKPPPKPSSAHNNSSNITTSAKRALPGTKRPRNNNNSSSSSSSASIPSSRKKKKGRSSSSSSSSSSSGLDNRSTVTTTTATAQTPVNVYDAVLGEAEDLLQAAREAQALGRLKMASAYQILLHARLIGLGKRFDRARIQPPKEQQGAKANQGESGNENMASANSVNGVATPTSNKTSSALALASTDATNTPATSKPTTLEKPGLNDLTQFLPSNIELDSAMMEHLARAAMELHHQRTGRKIQSDNSTASSQPNGSATTTPTSKNNNNSSTTTTTATSYSNTSTNPSSKPSLAWTSDEQIACQKLLSKGVSEAGIAAQIPSKTEAQVRAYLKNIRERTRGVRAVEHDLVVTEESPRKKGRGRKPATQAMNTVPNANLNAKYLLSGKPLI